MNVYQSTPLEIQKIINLFHKNALNYNLFKCEHIFAGENKNLDILFEDNNDYALASSLLEKEGFCLLLPEKVEKFKKMYVDFAEGRFRAIHLHREIAWHGVKALDKRKVFAKVKELAPGIIVPSAENSLLIHTAHVLFENFSIRDRERQLITNYLQKNLDWDYIKKTAQQNYWKSGLQHVLIQLKKKEEVEKKEIYINYLKKLWKQPITAIYLASKAFKKISKKVNSSRKGTLLALIGVNGAGKTTQSNLLLERYKPFTNFLGIKSKRYYFGWQPFSPIAKLGEKFFRKKNIFKEVTSNDGSKDGKREKINLFQEVLFVYNYIDYLFRYIFHIHLQLYNGDLVITDRYFYDIYGQYPYAEHSRLVKTLMKLFPKPDYTFILDAPTGSIMKREKSGAKGERKVKSEDYLAGQRERYFKLNNILKSKIIINTEENIENNIKVIINTSWKKIVKKLA